MNRKNLNFTDSETGCKLLDNKVCDIVIDFDNSILNKI